MVIYMKLKNNLFKFKNIVFLLVLVVLGTSSLVGLSYVFGVDKYFNDYTKNSIDSRLVYVGIKNIKNKANLKSMLEDNEHVLNVYESSEVNNFGIVNEFTTDFFDGDIEIIPIKNIDFDIVLGKSSIDNEGIMCPDDFFPSNYILNENYDKDKSISLKKYIGKYLNIKIFDEENKKIKLVGTFDRSKYFTHPNTCYINYKTYNSVFKNYNKISNEDTESHFVVLLDNIDNMQILDNFENISFYQGVTTLKISILKDAINLVSLIVVVLLVLSCLLCYLFSSRTIKNNYKNIGILKMVGYPNKLIKKKFYLLNLIISLFAFLLSVVLSIIIEYNCPKWFLSNKADLCLIKFTNSYVSYLICFILVVFLTFVNTILSLKKIDNYDIRELVNE